MTQPWNVALPMQTLHDAVDAIFLRCGFPEQFGEVISVVIEGVFPAPAVLFQET